MQYFAKKTPGVICLWILMFNALPATSFEEHKKAQMIQDLEVIKHHLEAGYAPAVWKKEYAGWDLEQAFEHSKNQILQTPSITTKQFQQIIRIFANSTQDYHVEVLFFSTESAALPFTVKRAEGRYFIDWIDPLRLPVSIYGIQVGDELMEFGGRAISEVIEELQREVSKVSNSPTDQRLAELKLTLRMGLAGDRVPKGSILLKTKAAHSDQIRSCQLHWSYTPEHVKNPLDFLQSLDFITALLAPTSKPKAKSKLQIPQVMMANPLHEIYAKKYADRNGGLGARKSFVPKLGEILWIKDDDFGDEDEEFLMLSINWYAYIYRHPTGRSIGYIRIPNYVGWSMNATDFGEIIQTMQEKTDALVIDQVHNFGGTVNFAYSLLPMLTSEPLTAPYHRVKINQKQALEAYKTIEAINTVEMMIERGGLKKPSPSKSSKEETDKEEIEKDEGEQPAEEDENLDEEEEFDIGFNYQELLFVKAYHELVLEDWNQGQTLTRPTPILGVDRINPHPKYQYTKPILMLIDEMDFSCADFVPAILQDNKRAVLFGSRTAGAGGFVFNFEFPNSHGIAHCSYTASIAERTNSKKIENLGVMPDITYQITLQDLQGGYQGYREAVNQAVETLLEKPQQPEAINQAVETLLENPQQPKAINQVVETLLENPQQPEAINQVVETVLENPPPQ